MDSIIDGGAILFFSAEEVIDHHASCFDEHVMSMDVVFDTAGGGTLARSWGVLKPGGRMVTIAAGVAEEDTGEQSR